MLCSHQKPVKGLTFLLQVHSALFRGQNNPKKVLSDCGGNCKNVYPLKTCDLLKVEFVHSRVLDQGCKILACPWKLLPSTSLTHGHSPSLAVVFHVNIHPCISIATLGQHKEANNDPCTYSHKISIKFMTLGRGRKLENVEVNPRVQTRLRETLSQKWTHARGSMCCNGKWNRAKTRGLWDTRGAFIA